MQLLCRYIDFHERNIRPDKLLQSSHQTRSGEELPQIHQVPLPLNYLNENVFTTEQGLSAIQRFLRIYEGKLKHTTSMSFRSSYITKM